MALLLLAVCSSLGIVFPDLDALLPPTLSESRSGLSTKPWGAPCFLLARMQPTGGRTDGTSSRVQQKRAPTASGKNYVLASPLFFTSLLCSEEGSAVKSCKSSGSESVFGFIAGVPQLHRERKPRLQLTANWLLCWQFVIKFKLAQFILTSCVYVCVPSTCVTKCFRVHQTDSRVLVWPSKKSHKEFIPLNGIRQVQKTNETHVVVSSSSLFFKSKIFFPPLATFSFTNWFYLVCFLMLTWSLQIMSECCMDVAGGGDGKGKGKWRRADLIGLVCGDSGAAVRQELRVHYTLLRVIYLLEHFWHACNSTISTGQYLNGNLPLVKARTWISMNITQTQRTYPLHPPVYCVWEKS